MKVERDQICAKYVQAKQEVDRMLDEADPVVAQIRKYGESVEILDTVQGWKRHGVVDILKEENASEHNETDEQQEASD